MLIFIGFSFYLVGMWPFGIKSIAAIDLGSQYLGFYDYFSNVVKGTEGVMYSFNKGAGGGMFALWTYYLMSPFNLIYALFNGERIIQGVHIVYVLKALAMTVTATYYFNKKGVAFLLNTIFTIGWVFSGYAIMYRINLMWLDALIYLPLLIIALDEGLQKGVYKKYILLLTLTIYSNYYIGYMVGLYTVVHVCYRWMVTDAPKALHIRQYIRGCLISGSLSLWILLPTAYSMIGGLRSEQSKDIFFSYHPANIIASLRFIDTSTKGYQLGSPLIMIGTGALIYLLTILIHVSKRKKIAFSLVSFIYLLAFTLRPISRIWTIGQDETWYLHRIAFTFIWIMFTFMTDNKDELRHTLTRLQAIVLTLIWIGSSIYLIQLGEAVYTIIGWITMVLGVFYGIVILFKVPGMTVFILILTIFETLAMLVYMGVFIDNKSVEYIEDLRTGQAETMEIVKQNRDEMSRVFFGLHEDNYNSGFSIGESTISHTSSTIGTGMRYLTSQLGVVESYSVLGVTGMNEIAAALLNVEYIDTQFVKNYKGYVQDNPQFEEVSEDLYYNHARLGFGYTIPELIPGTERELNFNGITEVLTGKHYVKQVELDIIDSQNITIAGDKYEINNDGDNTYITYAVTEPVNYIYKNRETIKVDGNGKDEGKKVDVIEIVFGNFFVYVDDLQTGTYKYDIKKGNQPIIIKEDDLPEFYYLDKEDFLEDITKYFDNHTSFTLTKIGKGSFEGVINNTHNQPYIQFSIPYEEGWKATVNGVEQEVYDSMNYLALSLPEGESHISFSYKTPLLLESIILSITLPLVIIVGDNLLFFLIRTKQKNKVGKEDERHLS